MSIYFAFALVLFTFLPVNGARVLLSLYALDLGAAPLAVGFLTATFSVFPMLLAVLSGKITDRVGARWPVLCGTVIVLCGMLVPYFLRGVPLLFVAAALNGFAFAFFSVSLQNLIGMMSPAQDRTHNFSIFSLMVASANFAGPLFAGFAIDHYGHATACLFAALLALIPMVMLAGWGGGLPGGTSGPRPAGGVRETLADPAVRKTLATGGLLMAGQDLFQTYMPVYGHGIGLSASAIGVVVGMFAAAAFVVQLVIKRLINRYSMERLLTYTLYLAAGTFLLMPFFKSATALAILAFIFGLAICLGQPIITMLMFSHSTEGRSGEALGLRITVNHLTRVVSPVVFGSIASALGVQPLFWISAILLGSGGAMTRPKT
ncbi:MAG: MFS transporter [Betaproteobacteria bacterium]|jgi:MFS family permease